MIKRFNRKLRMAGLEDALQYGLGVGSGTAAWLARLGHDAAQKDGVDLLDFRGPAQLTQLFWQLEAAGFGELLDRVAAGVPVFAESLASHRVTFGEPAWQRAA